MVRYGLMIMIAWLGRISVAEEFDYQSTRQEFARLPDLNSSESIARSTGSWTCRMFNPGGLVESFTLRILNIEHPVSLEEAINQSGPADIVAFLNLPESYFLNPPRASVPAAMFGLSFATRGEVNSAEGARLIVRNPDAASEKGRDSTWIKHDFFHDKNTPRFFNLDFVRWDEEHGRLVIETSISNRPAPPRFQRPSLINKHLDAIAYSICDAPLS